MITTFQDSPVITENDSTMVTRVSTLAHGELGFVVALPSGRFIASGLGDVSHIHASEELAINWLFVLWTNKGTGYASLSPVERNKVDNPLPKGSSSSNLGGSNGMQ